MTDKTDVQEVSALKDIGEALKKKRDELSYTLEHVSEVTCITHANLKNLEEGNLDDLPGPVFVKGFIKNYARFLRIESDWMIEALDDDKALNGQQPSDYIAGHSGVLGASEQSKGKYIIGMILLGLILGALFLWNDEIVSYFSDDKETLETINAVDTAMENEHSVISDARTEAEDVQNKLENIVGEQISQDIQNATADATGESKPDKQVISPLALVLVANENQWIRLSVDNGKPFDLWLNQGEHYSWPAQEEYSLTMSTGSVASIHLNGEEILEREKFMDQLYQVKLNKFTLEHINNR